METIPDGDWFCFECQNKVCPLLTVFELLTSVLILDTSFRTQLIKSVCYVVRKESF